jgi:transcriptional regulator with XRE-family HTH domain
MLPRSSRSEIGLCIAILRIARGWSQGQLGEAAGVTNSAISDYERGKVEPLHHTVAKILRALGAPLHLLDQTLDFLALARASMAADPPPALSAGDELPELPPEIAAEINTIAGEAGRSTARTTRMQLGLLAQLVHAPVAALRPGET